MENKLPNVKRISGNDRSETNAKVIEEFYTDTDLANVYITKNGSKRESDLIDSLAVGPLAAKNNAPIIIVGNELSEVQKNLSNTKSFNNITRVGGNGNEDAFKEIEAMQKVKTYEVKTINELNEIIKKADANDIIDFRPSTSINESFSIVTKNTITVNLYGDYTKTVTINMPNGDVVNNNSIENVVIDDIKDGTFINKGNLNNLILNDTNGSSVLNDKNGRIKNIKVEVNATEVNIANNGKIDNVNIESGASNIILDNKGSITNVKNNAEDTEIKNDGTINKVEGNKEPVIDGNKPNGSTGGSSSSGGSNNGGSIGGSTPEIGNKPNIDESKILASVTDDRTIYIKMDELPNVFFDITGSGYEGKVISNEYKGGEYILKLDKSLGKNCVHTLNINYGEKKYTKSIINNVIECDIEARDYFNGETITITTNKDESEFKSIDFKLNDKKYKFIYSGENWEHIKGFEIKSDKKGKTTVISINKQGGFNNVYPSDINFNIAKIQYADNTKPDLSINTMQFEDSIDIHCLFDENVKFYDSKDNSQINSLYSVKDRIKLYKNIDEKLELQENFKIDNIYMPNIITDNFTINSSLSNNLDYGSYEIKLEDIYIEDLSGNRVDREFKFKLGKNEEKVSTIEDLKRELEIGTKKILMQSSIKSSEDLFIDEGTNLIIPSGVELNADGKTIIVEGTVSGDGSISSNTNIKRFRNGIVFKPEIIDAGNSEIEIRNISKNSIKSIHINGTQFDRQFDGVYTTTYSNMQAIHLEEVEDKLNSKVKIKLRAGEHIENYPVVLYAGNNPTIKSEAIITSKITLEVDKSYLIGKYITCKDVYDKAIEGTETGQYVQGSKDIYKVTLDKANSIINNEDTTQKEVNDMIYELDEALDLFNISRLPKMATNMQELKEGLSNERVLLVSNDIDVTEDLTIRQDCILVIGEGKTLNIKGKNLLVLGRVVVNGNITKDGRIELGPEGVFDRPSIKETTIDGISSIGVANVGINSIRYVKVGRSEFHIGWNGRVYSTTNPEGIKVEYIENGPKLETEYNVTPITYLKISSDSNDQKPIYKVIVSDVYGNTDEVDMPITFSVDKTKLIEEIVLAEDIYNLAIEGIGNGEFEIGSKGIYKAAIDIAKGIEASETADITLVNKAIYDLKQATRAFRDKMVIPKVDNIKDLQLMISKKYMEKVIVVNNIENDTTLEVPEGVELEIQSGVTLTNTAELNINGLVSGEGSILNEKKGSILIGKYGVLFKPEVEEMIIDDTSSIKISNVGQKAINAILVDGVRFYEADNGVYSTTGANPKAIELRKISGDNYEGEANIQPNLYLTITSKQEINDCKVSVYDKYKQFKEIQIPLITVREN